MGKRRGRRRPRSKWDEDLFETELINARAGHTFISHPPIESPFRLEGVFDSRTKAWKNRIISG